MMSSSPQEFLDLCRQLREMGALEVTAGELSAKFAPPQVVLQAPRAPTPEEQRRQRALAKANVKDEPFPAVKGDTEADVERRRGYRDLTERLTGNG